MTFTAAGQIQVNANATVEVTASRPQRARPGRDLRRHDHLHQPDRLGRGGLAQLHARRGERLVTAAPTLVGHQWRLVAPWWHWPPRPDDGGEGPAETRRSVRTSAPVLQKYDVPDLVNVPGRSSGAIRSGDSRVDRGLADRRPDQVRKLFLASHHRHYLVSLAALRRGRVSARPPRRRLRRRVRGPPPDRRPAGRLREEIAPGPAPARHRGAPAAGDRAPAGGGADRAAPPPRSGPGCSRRSTRSGPQRWCAQRLRTVRESGTTRYALHQGWVVRRARAARRPGLEVGTSVPDELTEAAYPLTPAGRRTRPTRITTRRGRPSTSASCPPGRPTSDAGGQPRGSTTTPSTRSAASSAGTAASARATGTARCPLTWSEPTEALPAGRAPRPGGHGEPAGHRADARPAPAGGGRAPARGPAAPPGSASGHRRSPR